MSLHSDTMEAAGVPARMDQFGDAGRVRYLDPQADPVALTAIVGKIESTPANPVRGRGGRDQGTETRIVVITTDPLSVYGGVAKPQQRDALEIDGEKWVITAFEIKPSGLAKLTVERSQVLKPRGSEWAQR